MNELKPLTVQDCTNAFNATCSQIGELYCQRSELEDKIANLNERLDFLKLQRAQLITQKYTLDHNESAAKQIKENALASLEVPNSKPILNALKGATDGK